ncbi:MAG TPA: response regulator transcription factor [Gemmatimonadales bacterium]|nr:response regulator transcription factor [Gemmatimonadales bacterium]
MIRILLADDHRVVREGIRRLLEERNGFTIIGEAASAPELLAKLRETAADVVILDIAMPGPGIVETLRQIKQIQPRARSLVLTAYPETDYAVRVLRAGAAGYLTKDRSLEQLAEAIRRVYRGGMYVSPSLGEVLAAHLSRGETGPPHGALSDREFQVLTGLAQGESLKSIAARLAVSPKTVTTYRSRILEKLGLGTNAELVRYALEQGLLSAN